MSASVNGLMNLTEPDELTEQVRRLVEQGQPPAPVWVTERLVALANEAGRARALAETASADLASARQQIHEVFGISSSSVRGRTRGLAELVAAAEQQLAGVGERARRAEQEAATQRGRAEELMAVATRVAEAREVLLAAALAVIGATVAHPDSAEHVVLPTAVVAELARVVKTVTTPVKGGADDRTDRA